MPNPRYDYAYKLARSGVPVREAIARTVRKYTPAISWKVRLRQMEMAFKGAEDGERARQAQEGGTL
jgi:hypothetical protein